MITIVLIGTKKQIAVRSQSDVRSYLFDLIEANKSLAKSLESEHQTVGMFVPAHLLETTLIQTHFWFDHGDVQFSAIDQDVLMNELISSRFAWIISGE